MVVLGKSERRLFTAAEFRGLSDVPPEAEWFANIQNPKTRRASQGDIWEFMAFVGIMGAGEFRLVTRAQHPRRAGHDLAATYRRLVASHPGKAHPHPSLGWHVVSPAKPPFAGINQPPVRVSIEIGCSPSPFKTARKTPNGLRRCRNDEKICREPESVAPARRLRSETFSGPLTANSP